MGRQGPIFRQRRNYKLRYVQALPPVGATKTRSARIVLPEAEANQLRSSYQRLQDFMEHARYSIPIVAADITGA